MFNHKVSFGQNKFKPNKKSLILIIRKQPGEIDWILPILNEIKNNVNILVIFEKKIALKLLRENKRLFKIFEQTASFYFCQSFFRSFLTRFLNKICQESNLKFLSNYFSKLIFDKYYSLENFEYLIRQNQPKFDLKDVKILCQDFTDNSPWVKKFYDLNNFVNIIHYPHTTNIFSTNKESKLKQNNLNSTNHIFLSSFRDLNFFKKKYVNSNFYEIGYPKYSRSWLKKIHFNKKIKNEVSKTRIFIAYKGYDRFKYNLGEYKEQLNSLFLIAKKNNFQLLFKFHPNAQEEKEFLNIANSYSKNLWKITKKHLHLGSHESKIFISFFSNAAVLDALASNKIPIELWDIKLKKDELSNYSKLKLCISVKNYAELEKKIHLLIEPKKKLNAGFLKNYKKIVKTEKSISKAKKIIIQLLRF